MAVGTAVLLGAMSAFAMLNRVEDALAKKAEDRGSLALTHSAMSRAFASLMVPKLNSEANADSEESLVHLSIGSDDRYGSVAQIAGLETPSRIVMTLNQPPLPGLRVRDDASTEPTRAFRGAFELRRTRDRGWSVWWTPLPLRAGEPGYGLGLGTRELELISGVKRFEWRMFRADAWTQEYSASFTRDLPAFVELRLTTRDNMRHDWLFEVDFTSPPPIATPADEDVPNAEEVEDQREEVAGVQEQETDWRSLDGTDPTRERRELLR